MSQLKLWETKRMPITVTLKDETAIDLLSQITAALTQRNLPPPDPRNEYDRGVEETLDHVNHMNREDILNVRNFAREKGVPTNSVSNTIQGLKDRGVLSMVQRGTWQKR